MTVCIAAKSDGLGVIVTVSDMMLADDVGAMDVADIKTAELLWSDSRGSRSRWFCLYSGKPAIFDDLSNHIKEALAAAPDREWSSSELMREVENAYDAVINRRIEREVLAQQYRMDFDQLAALESSGGGDLVDQIGLKIGEAHGRITTEMLYQDPTELLVCGFGFDEGLRPQIFSSDGIGRCTPYTSFGFRAIGAGGRAAEAWLLANQESLKSERLSEIVYRLCEAKFVGENSPFVGKAVWVRVWFEDGTILPFSISAPPSDEPIQVMRRAWQSRIDQQPSADALAQIERYLRIYADFTGSQIYLSRKEREELRAAGKLRD